LALYSCSVQPEEPAMTRFAELPAIIPILASLGIPGRMFLFGRPSPGRISPICPRARQS
jgi:hypothetical protein